MAIKRMTLLDFIDHYEEDIDVMDTYADDLCIAYCPTTHLSYDGIAYFEDVLFLTCNVVSTAGYSEAYVDVETEAQHKLLKRLLYAMAGYCSEADYEKWFEVE